MARTDKRLQTIAHNRVIFVIWWVVSVVTVSVWSTSLVRYCGVGSQGEVTLCGDDSTLHHHQPEVDGWRCSTELNWSNTRSLVSSGHLRVSPCQHRKLQGENCGGPADTDNWRLFLPFSCLTLVQLETAANQESGWLSRNQSEWALIYSRCVYTWDRIVSDPKEHWTHVEASMPPHVSMSHSLTSLFGLFAWRNVTGEQRSQRSVRESLN